MTFAKTNGKLYVVFLSCVSQITFPANLCQIQYVVLQEKINYQQKSKGSFIFYIILKIPAKYLQSNLKVCYYILLVYLHMKTLMIK